VQETRQAGIAQGLVLSLLTFLPIMATVSLGAGMPSFREHFHAAAGAVWFVPMLLTVPAVFIAVISPIAGLLSDRLGRRRVLLAAIVLYGVCGVAPLLLDNLYVILGTRAGVGVSEGMLMTVGKTLVGDYFTGSRRQQWVGYQGVIDACLGSFTWLLGGYLASMGWRGPFFLYLVSIPLLLATAWLIWEPESRPPALSDSPAPVVAPFPWRTMSVLYAITFATGLMYFSYPVNIAEALKSLGAGSATDIGIVTALASIGTPLGAYLYARSPLRTNSLLLALALLFIGCGYLGIGASSGYKIAAMFGFVEQIGNGIAGAVLIVWCLSHLPFEHRGAGMGFWSTAIVAGIFTSSPFFTVIAQQTGGVSAAFTLLGCTCLGMALLVGGVRRLRATGPYAAATH
jgi:MFS family permease